MKLPDEGDSRQNQHDPKDDRSDDPPVKNLMLQLSWDLKVAQFGRITNHASAIMVQTCAT